MSKYKVYKIRLELDTFVLAESEKNARAMFVMNSCSWVEETNLNEEGTVLVEEVTSIDQVPESWRDCYPHAERWCNAPCRQIQTILREEDE